MYTCVIASLQAHASESNTTQRGETNSEEKTPFKTQSSGCLLQALSKPSRRTLACSCLLLTAGRREKCRVVDRRPQHQKRPLFATTRKPASACVREQRNTTEEEQKARKQTPIKTHPSGCLLQALKKQEMHVYLRHRKPASACVREQHNTKRGNKQRGENAIQNAVKRLLTASFVKTQQTHACVLLSAPHSRPP